MAISVPFMLDAAAERLERGVSRLYQRHLVNSLRVAYRRKFARMSSPLDIDLDELRTFRLFDDQVTAPLHGFQGVDHYYDSCSSRQFIPHIHVPTLILHARDDPFMFSDTAPGADELPDQVWLELTAGGGHVGFIAGNLPLWADYFLERRVAEWLTPARG